MSADGQAKGGGQGSSSLGVWFAKLIALAVAGVAAVVFTTWWQKNGSAVVSPDPVAPAATTPRQVVSQADPQDEKSLMPARRPPRVRPERPTTLTVGEVIDRVGPGVVLITCLDSKGKEYGLGSGFVIDPSGLVATSFHVVRRAWKSTATFSDGTKIAVAGCRAWDPDGDLAILELAKMPTAAKTLALSSDEDPKPASAVVAIGHPQGFKFTTTTGIVSGVHRTKELPEPYAREIHAPAENVWLQTNAAISSGNSGGPLLNMNGEVLGVNTWIAQGQNLGFAVDARHLRALKGQLKPKSIPLAELTGPEEQLLAMFGEYNNQYDWLQEQAAKSWTAAMARQFVESKHPAIDFLPKFYQFAEDHRGIPAAFHALQMICLVAGTSDVPKVCNSTMKSASERLLADFRDDERLISSVMQLMESPLDEAAALCRKLADQSQCHRLQGFALYALAFNLQGRVAPKSDSPPNAEAIAALERIAREFQDVQIGETDLASRAEQSLFEIQHLGIGRTAIDIVGNDSAGTEFKLSDFRGKIVVLDFWVDWCPHCVAMYPVERDLVKKYEGKPFAIVGVNCDEPSRLKRVLDAKTVTWRNWMNGPDGPISNAWHVHSFPTLYVLDQNGVIRYRDVRGHDLEKAVADLMAKLAAPKSDDKSKPAAVASDDKDLRTWTRTDGKVAELRFLAVERDTAKFQRPDGRELSLPLAMLSQSDRDWIRDRGKKQGN